MTIKDDLSFKILTVYYLPCTHKLIVNYLALNDNGIPIVNVETTDGSYTMIQNISKVPKINQIKYLVNVYFKEGLCRSTNFKVIVNEHLARSYKYHRDSKGLIVANNQNDMNFVNHCKNFLIEIITDIEYKLHYDLIIYNGRTSGTTNNVIETSKPPTIVDIYRSLYKHL